MDALKNILSSGKEVKIAIGSDHAGFELKEGIIPYLISKNYRVENVGCFSTESVDYPVFAKKVVDLILNNKTDAGILICGTGLGMAMTANRFKNIRATPAINSYTVKMSRLHNDSNIITFGGRFHTLYYALDLLDLWLSTPFEGGRHIPRLKMIDL